MVFNNPKSKGEKGMNWIARCAVSFVGQTMLAIWSNYAKMLQHTKKEEGQIHDDRRWYNRQKWQIKTSAETGAVCNRYDVLLKTPTN